LDDVTDQASAHFINSTPSGTHCRTCFRWGSAAAALAVGRALRRGAAIRVRCRRL